MITNEQKAELLEVVRRVYPDASYSTVIDDLVQEWAARNLSYEGCACCSGDYEHPDEPFTSVLYVHVYVYPRKEGGAE